MNALTQTLTEQQAEFVRHAARGVDSQSAALLAGYSPRHLETAVGRLKSNPLVQSAIASAVRQFLHTEAAPKALQVLYNVMTDEKEESKLRVACAKTLADRAGFIAPKASENKDLGGKSLTEMTAEELRERSQQIMRELSERATVVIDATPDNAPSAQADGAYPIDILG